MFAVTTNANTQNGGLDSTYVYDNYTSFYTNVKPDNDSGSEKVKAENDKQREKQARLAYQREAKKRLNQLMYGDLWNAPYEAESVTELFLDSVIGYPNYRPDDFKSTSMKHAEDDFNQVDKDGEENHYLYILDTMQHYGLVELYSAKIDADMLNLDPKHEYWHNFEDNDTKNAWKTALQRVFPLMSGGIEVGRHSFKTHAHIIFDMRQVKDKNILAAAGNSKNFKRITSKKALLGAYCYYRKEKLHFPTEALPDTQQFTYWIECKQERRATGQRRAPSTWKWGIPKLSKVLAMSHEAVPNRIVTPGIWSEARNAMDSYISGENKNIPTAVCAEYHLRCFPDTKPDMFLDNPNLAYNVHTLTSYLDFCRLECSVFDDSIRYVNFSKKPSIKNQQRFQTFVEDRPKYYQNLKRRIKYQNLNA